MIEPTDVLADIDSILAKATPVVKRPMNSVMMSFMFKASCLNTDVLINVTVGTKRSKATDNTSPPSGVCIGGVSLCREMYRWFVPTHIRECVSATHLPLLCGKSVLAVPFCTLSLIHAACARGGSIDPHEEECS